ncbi:GrdX family protein [Treponema sp. OMZ 855]|uniref:GrdX family protein n=1 Tax=Treponema sp. OMZ 855 TaxID=1643512 RepID=UPI0020A52CB0|nr:GrdX family protein [Treponema sp. OMZ 855]UTC50886.1 GrdX family protein [Treponema sp. OMZ 855]
MKQLIITNNPQIAEYLERTHEDSNNSTEAKDIKLIFCTTREELYIQVRDYIHRNWKLQNHAMYGNIQLHKQPYRSMVLTEGTELDTRSLQLWEQAMERVNRTNPPTYSEKVLKDFQALDFSLFNSIVSPT